MEEIPDGPMYVVVQFSAGATARFRRTVYYAQGHDTAEEAEELAEHRRLVAKAGGRHRDRYEVYELVKPGDREAAHQAGREAAARDSCGCLGYVPVGQQPRTLQQQCPERHFGCRSCRCVLPAGHDGEHDVHCGQPT